MKKSYRNLSILVVVFALLFSLAGCETVESTATNVDSFPSDPITIVVPYNPGGGVDTSTRTIQAALQEAAGVNIVVENRPGGGMSIGYNYVAGVKPDGYTLLAAPIPTMIFTEITMRDQLKCGFSDYKPVGAWINDDCSPLIVASDSPYTDLASFIEAAKSSTLRLGLSGGAYSTDHMTYALLAEETGVSFNLVPYDSSGDALAALQGGHVDAVLASLVTGVSAQEAGTARILGVTTDERAAVAPEVPTFKEQGVDVVIEFHIGLFAAPGTPDDIVKKLSDILTSAATSDDFKARVQEVKSPAGEFMDCEAWGEYCKSEYSRWSEQIGTLDKYPLG